MSSIKKPPNSDKMELRQTQRVALVCDWLTTPGGAEKVLLELHRIYPEAPIYTSQYSRKGIDWFDDATVKTGWLQIFPAGLRKFLGPLRQIYFSHLDLSDYDLVISVTGAEAKAIRTQPKNITTHTGVRHICYCHVPTQYYWQMYDKYLENPGFGVLNPLVKFCFKLLVKPLRQADYRAAQRPDQFVTISSYAKEQIAKYYQREAVIIAPPVEIEKFTSDSCAFPKHCAEKATSTNSSDIMNLTRWQEDYYIIACRQANWKRVDLAIAACKMLQKPLLVVGDGPEHAALEKLADGSPWIKFLPWASSTELAGYLQKAKGYIFPSLEPFGIAAVEALAAGCPVIAYAQGGSRDFVQSGQNGVLFAKQTAASLAKALEKFEKIQFDRTKVAKSAAKFSTAEFDRKIHEISQRKVANHENLP